MDEGWFCDVITLAGGREVFDQTSMRHSVPVPSYVKWILMYRHDVLRYNLSKKYEATVLSVHALLTNIMCYGKEQDLFAKILPINFIISLLFFAYNKLIQR